MLADEDTQVNDASSGDGSIETTSDATELTPEQRDEQTIARAFGLDQTDEESGKESEAAESEESDDESESSDETKDDETKSDDESEAESETKAEDEADESDTGAEASGEESDADDDVELSDENIETFLDAVTEDRLLLNPRMQKKLESLVQSQVDKQFQQRLEQTEVSQETDNLIKQGAKAAEAITGQFVKAGETLTKYVEGEEDIEEVVLDPEDLKTNLRRFAVASALKTRQGYDQAFATAFRETAPLSGEAFTQDEAKAVIKLVETADRIRSDPEQGEAAANTYLFTESFKLLVERAKSAGKVEAETARKKRNDAAKRVIGDKTSTNVALAKVAAKRNKLPKKGPTQEAEATEGNASMEAYRAAKLRKDYDEADRILAELQTAGQGQQVPDSQRRG